MPRPPRFAPRLLALSFLCCLLLALPDGASAGVITVNSNGDDITKDNFMTLREAIFYARADYIEHTICLSNAERALVAGACWASGASGPCPDPVTINCGPLSPSQPCNYLAEDNCPQGVGRPGMGLRSRDTIVFAPNVTVIMLGSPLPGLGIGDSINGLKSDGTKVVIDGSGITGPTRIFDGSYRLRGPGSVIARDENATDSNTGVNGLFLTFSYDGRCAHTGRAEATNSSIRNLVIRNFTGHGIEGVGVQGATFQGLDISNVGRSGVFLHAHPQCRRFNSVANVIGGPSPGEGNFIHGSGEDGIRVEVDTRFNNPAAHNIRIEGNVIGLGPGGNTNPAGRGRDGVRLVNVRGSIVGGNDPSYRNVIVDRGADGVHVEGPNAAGNVVRHNLVGVTPNGAAVVRNGETGVWVGGASGNTVADNVIAGNNRGVALVRPGTNSNVVRGNFIGTNAALAAGLGNTLEGVLVEDAANNVVGAARGSEADSDGNTIAFNATGVRVVNGAGNTVRRNRIFSNTGMAVDLDPAGRAPNDPLDADGGSNNAQNHPETTRVVPGSAPIRRVEGRLSSAPGTRFRVDYLSGVACTPGGVTNAQPGGGPSGPELSVPIDVTTDANGLATFTMNVAARAGVPLYLAATATNLTTGDTSELSDCFNVTGPQPVPQQGGAGNLGIANAVNCASAALGASAVASSEYPGYPASSVIDGRRYPPRWDNAAGDAWVARTQAGQPDWVEVHFSAPRAVDEIRVFTLQDDPEAKLEPTPEMTFSQYGLRNFEVQYWDGSQWVTVPGGVVTNNNLVMRTFAFAPVTTGRIRLFVPAQPGPVTVGNFSRVVEVEATCRARPVR